MKYIVPRTNCSAAAGTGVITYSDPNFCKVTLNTMLEQHLTFRKTYRIGLKTNYKSFFQVYFLLATYAEQLLN